MEKLASVLCVTLISAFLAGCSSNYAIHTNDGRTIISEGKPSEDNATGLIKYKDANGTQQQINRDEVREMSEIER
ncbi:YgdI/YgdR family lipoprotein [Serratia odorifera]|uniref:YgdI/YgdR family lipoprotein n=1 Tax=Serratia odorifera TaxID=618 RepID=UPI003531BC16